MKTFAIILAVILLAIGGYYLYQQQFGTSSSMEESPTTEDTSTGGMQGKLDINAVCEGALAYMTFESGDAAAQFVAECKEGKHPEVIDQYLQQMGLGDGAAI